MLRLQSFRQWRRHFVLASMLMERLHIWSQSDGLYILWKTLQNYLCGGKSTGSHQSAAYNVSRTLFWAHQGRYSKLAMLYSD